MGKKILFVGLNQAFISALKKEKDVEVYILEKRDILEKRGIDSSFVKNIRYFSYQNTGECLKKIYEWHEEIHFDAIIPGVEYAVKTAEYASEMLSLKSLGTKSADCLTDKLLLRKLCDRFNIPQPNYKELKEFEDILKFYRGEKLIIKPRNMQASIGVTLVDGLNDVKNKYENMINSREMSFITTEEIEKSYMIEDYIEGKEISIEALIQDGELVFFNVTEKEVSNKNFVELRHSLPANLDKDIINTLIKYKKKLIFALEAQNGILHSEWKINNGIPSLIECAGRVPGDNILDLIELSYDFNVYRAIVDILLGCKHPQVNKQPKKGSCILYFNPGAGKLIKINGENSLNNSQKNDIELIDWNIFVNSGDTIRPLLNSWSRVGYIMTCSKNVNDAKKSATYYNNLVNFTMYEE